MCVLILLKTSFANKVNDLSAVVCIKLVIAKCPGIIPRNIIWIEGLSSKYIDTITKVTTLSPTHPFPGIRGPGNLGAPVAL